MKNILVALELNYGKLEGMGVLDGLLFRAAGLDQRVLDPHDPAVLQYVHRGIIGVGSGHVLFYGTGDDGGLLRVGEGRQPGGGGGSRPGACQISAFIPFLCFENLQGQATQLFAE